MTKTQFFNATNRLQAMSERLAYIANAIAISTVGFAAAQFGIEQELSVKFLWVLATTSGWMLVSEAKIRIDAKVRDRDEFLKNYTKKDA